MSDYDRWEEAAERAEKRRYLDAQHKRETRAVTTVVLAVIATFAFLMLLAARGCSQGADRAHELEMVCVTHGGSWKATSQGGSCTQKDPQ